MVNMATVGASMVYMPPQLGNRKSYKKLGSLCNDNGYSQEWKVLMCRSMSKEVRMRQRNVAPIMMLQSSASVANGHLADKWHDPEIVAGERLEAWDDLTGLSLNP